jgi:hypothetical protein
VSKAWSNPPFYLFGKLNDFKAKCWQARCNDTGVSRGIFVVKAKLLLNILMILIGATQFASASESSRFLASLFTSQIDGIDSTGTFQVVKMEEPVFQGTYAQILMPYVELRYTDSKTNQVSAVRSDAFPTLTNAKFWFNKDAQVLDQKLNFYCLPSKMNPLATPPGEALRLSPDQAASAVLAVAQVTSDPLKRNQSLDQLNKICNSVLEANARKALEKDQSIDPAQLIKNWGGKKTAKSHGPAYSIQLNESESKADEVKENKINPDASHMIVPAVGTAATTAAEAL